MGNTQSHPSSATPSTISGAAVTTSSPASTSAASIHDAASTDAAQTANTPTTTTTAAPSSSPASSPSFFSYSYWKKSAPHSAGSVPPNNNNNAPAANVGMVLPVIQSSLSNSKSNSQLSSSPGTSSANPASNSEMPASALFKSMLPLFGAGTLLMVGGLAYGIRYGEKQAVKMEKLYADYEVAPKEVEVEITPEMRRYALRRAFQAFGLGTLLVAVSAGGATYSIAQQWQVRSVPELNQKLHETVNRWAYPYEIAATRYRIRFENWMATTFIGKLANYKPLETLEAFEAQLAAQQAAGAVASIKYSQSSSSSDAVVLPHASKPKREFRQEDDEALDKLWEDAKAAQALYDEHQKKLKEEKKLKEKLEREQADSKSS